MQKIFLILLLGLLGMLVPYDELEAQNTSFKFSQTSIAEVIQKIENNTDFTFNYDPAHLNGYTFTGKLNFNEPQKALLQLLYPTPLIFEIFDQNILLLLPEKQSYRICGTLKNEANSTTIPFVNIALAHSTLGTQTDENGYFELTVTAYKNEKVNISHLGYYDKYLFLQDFDLLNCPPILLQSNTHKLGEIIIIDNYLLEGVTEGEAYGALRLNYEELSRNNATLEHDILKTIQLLPGISSIDESATNLQIRGATPDHNLILWENAPLYDPGHLFGMISSVNPFVVDEVNVYKGVGDPSYDNRVGGIVNMSLSDAIPKQFTGGIGTTLTEAHSYLAVPIVKNKLAVLLAGRSNINGIINTPTITSYTSKLFQDTKIEDAQIEAEEGDRANEQTLIFYDINTKLLWQPNEKIKLKASLFNSQNNFTYFSELYNAEYESTDQVLFKSQAVSSSLAFSPHKKATYELAYIYSSYENNYFFNFIETEDDTPIHQNYIYNDIIDASFNLSANYLLKDNWEWKLGYSFNKKKVQFDYVLLEDYFYQYNDNNYVEGRFHNLFSAIHFNRKKLNINGGIRVTYYEEEFDWDFSPRINLQYAINNKWKLKTSAGVFHQYISTLKEFGSNDLGVSNPVWVLSRTESGASLKAQKLAVGTVFHHKGWLIDLEAYYNYTDGLNTHAPLINSDIFIEDILLGSSEARGIDFLLRKKWKHYSFWINYALGKTTYFFPDLYDSPFLASNDQRHNLSFMQTFNYKSFDVSLNWQVRSGLPFSEPYDIWEEYDEEEDETYYGLDYEAYNNHHFDFYQRLDLGIHYRPTFKSPRYKAEIAFSIINLINKTNIFSRDYFVDDIVEEIEVDGELEEVIVGYEAVYIERSLLKRTPQILLRFSW